MLKTLRYILCCHVVLVFLFSSCDGARMRQELNRIDSLNMARVNLDTITKMDEVVRYFDNYGTSNERMLAHYLHGRVIVMRWHVLIPQNLTVTMQKCHVFMDRWQTFFTNSELRDWNWMQSKRQFIMHGKLKIPLLQ